MHYFDRLSDLVGLDSMLPQLLNLITEMPKDYDSEAGWKVAYAGLMASS